MAYYRQFNQTCWQKCTFVKSCYNCSKLNLNCETFKSKQGMSVLYSCMHDLLWYFWTCNCLLKLCYIVCDLTLFVHFWSCRLVRVLVLSHLLVVFHSIHLAKACMPGNLFWSIMNWRMESNTTQHQPENYHRVLIWIW
jgi:hypothetical protein